MQPEFREYERFSTTTLNAYLQSVMHDYIARLEDGLAELAPNAALGINQSSGGLMSLGTARGFPVRTALSGPAAGVIGALQVAKSAGAEVPFLRPAELALPTANIVDVFAHAIQWFI